MSNAHCQDPRVFLCHRCLVLIVGISWLWMGCEKIASKNPPTGTTATNDSTALDPLANETKLDQPGFWRTEALTIISELVKSGQVQTIYIDKISPHAHVILPPAVGVARQDLPPSTGVPREDTGSVFAVAERATIPPNTRLMINLTARGPNGPIRTVEVSYQRKGVRGQAVLSGSMWEAWRSCSSCAVGYFELPTEELPLTHP